MVSAHSQCDDITFKEKYENNPEGEKKVEL